MAVCLSCLVGLGSLTSTEPPPMNQCFHWATDSTCRHENVLSHLRACRKDATLRCSFFTARSSAVQPLLSWGHAHRTADRRQAPSMSEDQSAHIHLSTCGH